MALWLTINFLNRICHSEPCISIPSCFLGIVSGFINQGYDLKLHSYSGRVLLIFALMLGVVLYSAMNAVLVAQLAIFDIPFPFESLDDIPVKRTHSLCLRTNSFVYNNFTDAYKNVLPHWTGVLNGRGCLDINNQTNLAKILCNDSIIFLENRVVLPNVMKNHNIECNVINFKQRYFKKDNVFLMAKSFRGKVKIDNFVKKMRTVGVLQRLEYKWIKNEQLTEIKTISSPQVTMKHIESVLHMYIIMIALSLVFLACEITHNKLFNVKRYQNNTFYN
ncbi:uncharacterized protein LOC109594867 isoform X2 [Aethina tumida]|nr:uncharacterized protein LOC109594867 isoform X2 [Aethina tumida]